jgi:hypothetical protein
MAQACAASFYCFTTVSYSFPRPLSTALILAATIASTGCKKLEPKDCGTYQPLPLVNYELVNATTGRTIFTLDNPITPDSVRLFNAGSSDRYGRELDVVRYGSRITLGPDYAVQAALLPAQGGTLEFTKYLKLGAHDTDTILIRATYSAVEATECGNSQKLTQLEFAFNNQPVGTYRYASVFDSTFQFGLQPYGKLLKLRKRQ